MMNRLLKTLALIPAVGLMAACETGPVAPELQENETPVAFSEASMELRTEDGKTALEWGSPLWSSQTASAWLGESGGYLYLPGPRMSVTVPRGALHEGKNIQMTALPGRNVLLRFGPHGTHFDKDVEVHINLSYLANGSQYWSIARTNYYKGMYEAQSDGSLHVPVGSLKAIYYAEQDGEVVKTIEEIEVLLSTRGYLLFYTDHFSGYALAS